jgi:hypothetical protein
VKKKEKERGREREREIEREALQTDRPWYSSLWSGFFLLITATAIILPAAQFANYFVFKRSKTFLRIERYFFFFF